MAIKYNPYGWEIRGQKERQESIEEIIERKETERQRLLELLERHKHMHYASTHELVAQLFELQEQIYQLYKERDTLGRHDHRPCYEFLKYMGLLESPVG